MANVTVQESIDRLKRQFDDTLGEISDALYLDWLNDLNFIIYRELVDQNPEKFILETTISASGGVDLSLPSDFKNINPITCGVFDDEKRQFVKTSFGSRISGYFTRGTSTIVFTPDDFDSQVVTLRYIPVISKLTATTDTLVIDFEDLESVINWLDKEYGQWNLDTTRELNADSRFIRSLTQLSENAVIEQDIFITN